MRCQKQQHGRLVSWKGTPIGHWLVIGQRRPELGLDECHCVLVLVAADHIRDCAMLGCRPGLDFRYRQWLSCVVPQKLRQRVPGRRSAGEDERQRVRGGVLEAVGMTLGDGAEQTFAITHQQFPLNHSRDRPTRRRRHRKWSESFLPSWMLLIASTESSAQSRAQCNVVDALASLKNEVRRNDAHVRTERPRWSANRSSRGARLPCPIA